MPDVAFWDTSAYVAFGNRDDDLNAATVAVIGWSTCSLCVIDV